MRIADPVWDGDQGPIFERVIVDAGAPRDFATAAVEMYIEDEDGLFIARRPCVIQTPKSAGKLRVFWRGLETDWDGGGKTLILKPRFYYATALDGTPATNLLVNPSLDAATGASPARLPDSWTLVGARTATWDNFATDAAPPSIFGTVQAVSHAGLSDPDYIQQTLAVSLGAGDTLSVGCWHRLDGLASQASGSAKNNTHALFFHCGAQGNSFVQFEIGTQGWYFVTGSVVTPTVETTCVMGIDGRGTTSSNRYDEAFCFKGKWRAFFGEKIMMEVKQRSRVPKTGGNLVAGVGSFEQDSNGDGFPDGYARSDPTNVYSIEKNAANVAHDLASLKVVLNDATARLISTTKRGRYLSGETWKVSVKSKTSGALGSGAGSGGFSIGLRSDYFDNTPPQSAATNLGTNDAAFTTYSAQMTLTADHSLLILEIKLNGKTGTMWLDDLQLTRV